MSEHLDRLRRLRRLLTPPQPTPDLDRSISALLAEVDRRDGPGAGERLLWEVAEPWLAENRWADPRPHASR
jgi:hypothetical protein